MRKLALALLVPLAFAIPSPATAATECTEVYTRGTTLGDRRVARHCLGWSGNWICTHSAPGTAQARIEVWVCTPSA